MKLLLPVLFIMLTASHARPAVAGPLTLNPKDSVQIVLSAHVGKQVSVRLKSGEEMTGLVRSVGPHIVHLGGLSGREYFDAVIDTASIEAVIIRVRDK